MVLISPFSCSGGVINSAMGRLDLKLATHSAEPAHHYLPVLLSSTRRKTWLQPCGCCKFSWRWATSLDISAFLCAWKHALSRFCCCAGLSGCSVFFLLWKISFVANKVGSPLWIVLSSAVSVQSTVETWSTSVLPGAESFWDISWPHPFHWGGLQLMSQASVKKERLSPSIPLRRSSTDGSSICQKREIIPIHSIEEVFNWWAKHLSKERDYMYFDQLYTSYLFINVIYSAASAGMHTHLCVCLLPSNAGWRIYTTWSPSHHWRDSWH